MKYPDYLDILIALIGRAPNAGRTPTPGGGQRWKIAVDVPLEQLDDAFYPTLGYHVGMIASNDIPVLTGLERAILTADDLARRRRVRDHLGRRRTFHIVGNCRGSAHGRAAPVGPDPAGRSGGSAGRCSSVAQNMDELNSAAPFRVPRWSRLGNPHFSLTSSPGLPTCCDGPDEDPGRRGGT